MFIMRKEFLFSCFLFSFLTTVIYSQPTNNLYCSPLITHLRNKDTTGEVKVIQDKRIDSLIIRYINENIAEHSVPGFRIRIFSANNLDLGRQRATDAKRIFLEKFSDLGEEVYIIQESPDWKVYVGDFRTRTDAYRIKKQLDSVFPNNRIVECRIDYTKL